MASFVFEPASDEELDLSPAEEEDSDDEQEVEEQEEAQKKSSDRKTQSPWDFAAYSESVAEEHARRSTTSIDYKISKALQERSVPIANPDEDDASDSELDQQVLQSLSIIN